jgi:hypothetical protein
MTRLACAFEDLGATVIDLSVPGWRATADAVEEMRGQLSTVLEENFNGETFLVYQLFDNSCYKSCNHNNERALPVKLFDNKYHIPGRLVFADKDEFREMFTITLPLLRAGLMHTKILLTPLMRYVTRPCCDNPGHITNRHEPGYGPMLAEAICEAKGWLKGLAFTRRIKNFSVICPNEMLGMEDRHFWGSDPVHMEETGYKEMGKRLIEAMTTTELCRKPSEVKTTFKKPSTDWAAKRASWVTENDSQVHRDYGGQIRGQRGHVGNRGRGASHYRGRGRGFRRGQKFRPY